MNLFCETNNIVLGLFKLYCIYNIFSDSLKITYSRSSGPGGQNVNSVNTKVDTRFHVETAEWLNTRTRAKIADIVSV